MQSQKRCFLLIICLSFLTSAVTAQDLLNCKPFKKGCFLFEADSGEIYLIKRTKNQQKELELKSGNQVLTKVKWLDDCVYKLSQEEKADSLQEINIPIIIRIKAIDGNTYHFISSSFDDFLSFEGKMRKITRKEYRRKMKSMNNEQ